MNPQRAAELQVVLEGVLLPATKRDLIDYAREHDPHAAEDLLALPDREYRALDDVSEALRPVQPAWPKTAPAKPRDESGQPPGGDAYTDPNAEPGAVRPSGPASNPPEKALQQQTKTQKQQQERQQHLG